jgi:hypothetical protein
VLWGREVEGNQNRGVNFASAALGGNSGVETGVEMSTSFYLLNSNLCILRDISQLPRIMNLCSPAWSWKSPGNTLLL